MTQPAHLQLVDDSLILPQPIAPDPEQSKAWATGHDVQFYETDEFLFGQVSSFMVDGIRAGQPIIVIATEAHRKGFAERMRVLGFDVADLVEGRDMVWLDARETLSAFMQGPVPNPELFEATVGNVFDKLMTNRKYLVVRAYGEMVDLLWKDGNIEGALALEELWNALAVKYSFSLLCAYSMGNFFKEAHTHSFLRVCDTHAKVSPTESYLLASEPDRLRQITILQQRARALEAELQHRKELESALRDVLAHRARIEDQLRRSEAELRDFLDNAPEGMHWVDAAGLIIWANRADYEPLGYTRSEFVGHHIAEFHADRQVVADILARLARGESLSEYESTLVCKDGSHRHVLISSNVLREDGKFVHTRCFTRDVTRFKAAMVS